MVDAYFAVVAAKSLGWTLAVTAFLGVLTAYTVWRLLGLSTQRKLLLCLATLSVAFIPDIVPSLTLQRVCPRFPAWAGLFLAHVCSGFPFLLIAGVLLARQFETSDCLAARLLLPPARRFWRGFLPAFVQSAFPVLAFLFLWNFHNFSLPALWEIELMPNYLFAEFNTYCSFAPFFVKIACVVAALLAVLLVSARLLGRNRLPAASHEQAVMGGTRLAPAVIIGVWLLITLVFPAAYWSAHLIGTRHLVVWSKVFDCWWYTLAVIATTATIAVAAAVLLSSLARVSGAVARGLFVGVYAVGPVAIAVLALWLFSCVPGLTGFTGTSVPLLTALAVHYVPFALLLYAFARLRIHPNVWRAADLLLTTRWRRLARVELPLLAPVLFVVVVLIGSFVSRDIDTSILLVPAGRSLLPTRLHLLLHYGDFATLAVLVATYLLLMLCGLSALYLVSRTLIRYGYIED